MWFLLLTAVVAGNLEVAGWFARTDSHFHPGDLIPYLVQTVTTINAPTPLVAAYFIILAEIIRRLGPCYSRLKPRMCKFLYPPTRLICEPELICNPHLQMPSSSLPLISSLSLFRVSVAPSQPSLLVTTRTQNRVAGSCWAAFSSK